MPYFSTRIIAHSLTIFDMAGPAYGALGGTFKVVRILQVVSLISIIGMAANLISGMVSQNYSPSDVVVGTLSVVGSPPS